MRRFRDIIEDIKAPSIQNLWLNGGKLKYYGENGWQDIKDQDTPTVKWDDIDDKPESFTPSSHTHTKSDITDFPTLATVATSGSYDDLSNKPTIPSAYTLPIASASALGGVKSATTGTTSGRDYKVQINSDGTMKVNVPWVDLNTTYAKATNTTLGLVMIGYTENDKNYPVELDENGKMFVNVPWTDANTTYDVATQSANGLMSSTDKQKLDTLILVPTGGTAGQVLKKTSDGVAWQNDNNTTYSVASDSSNGLMSAADKSKLDNIASNANNYTLPNASTSARGGVLMATAVTDLAGTEDATAICTKVNALLSALRASGALQS